MKCFISVAKWQNMSDAAREMLVTRPAMTAQMNALEAEMGATLLVRDKKGTLLTPAGKRALEMFKAVIAQLDDLDEEVRLIERRKTERLRIGFHGHAEWMGMSRLLSRFHDEYPNVEIQISELPWNALIADVEEGALDVAFAEISDVRDSTSLECVPLFNEDVCAIMHSDNPLARNETITPEQLAGVDVILPSASVSPRYLRDVVKSLREIGVEVREMGFGNMADATIVLAGAGYGVALAPRSFKQNLRDVAFVDVEGGGMTVSMGLIWRKGADSQALRSFRSLCESWPWEGEPWTSAQ